MNEPSSGPPSYVPTLTQVVHVVDEALYRPPAFLTQSTESDQLVSTATNEHETGQSADSATGALAPSNADTQVIQASHAIQARLVARVLERVDLTLETRLHEALAPLIRAHLQDLLPRLQDEIELTVRETVIQAFEHESLLRVSD